MFVSSKNKETIFNWAGRGGVANCVAGRRAGREWCGLCGGEGVRRVSATHSNGMETPVAL